MLGQSVHTNFPCWGIFLLFFINLQSGFHTLRASHCHPCLFMCKCTMVIMSTNCFQWQIKKNILFDVLQLKRLIFTSFSRKNVKSFSNFCTKSMLKVNHFVMFSCAFFFLSAICSFFLANINYGTRYTKNKQT